MPLKLFKESIPAKNSTIKNKLVIAAGKGGVGKSTLTVNLALALKKQGFRVGVMDLDVYGPSVRKMLPEDKMPEQEGEWIIPAVCQGIPMISMAYFRKENESAAVRAPIANGIVTHFVKNVLWGELDFLLLDFPPGTGDVQLTLCQQLNVDAAVMITTPQDVAVMDVRKAMHLFRQVKVPILGIVENMSYYLHPTMKEKLYLFGEGGGERLSQESGVAFLGQIPVDPLISRSGDLGNSYLEHQGGSVFLQLATTIKKELAMLQSAEKSIQVKNIGQKDAYTIAIEWLDGTLGFFKLNDLQQQCPCAGCSEQSVKKQIPEGLKAHQVTSVGKYAIKIQFASGCSNGIFSFEQLYKMARGEK